MADKSYSALVQPIQKGAIFPNYTALQAKLREIEHYTTVQFATLQAVTFPDEPLRSRLRYEVATFRCRQGVDYNSKSRPGLPELANQEAVWRECSCFFAVSGCPDANFILVTDAHMEHNHEIKRDGCQFYPGMIRPPPPEKPVNLYIANKMRNVKRNGLNGPDSRTAADPRR